MIEHNKNFYSLEELKRTRDSLEGYLDNEEVYYFVGAIRYACDEIERLKKREQECIDHYLVQCKYASEMEDKYITANNIINELEKFLKDKIDSWERQNDDLIIKDTIYHERLAVRLIYDYLQELKGSE